MKQKQHSTAEIIRILRQGYAGRIVEYFCWDHTISTATFHRWKRKYDNMDSAYAKWLKELEMDIQSIGFTY